MLKNALSRKLYMEAFFHGIVFYTGRNVRAASRKKAKRVKGLVEPY